MSEDHSQLIHFWQTATMTLFGVLTTIAAFWFGIMRHLLKKEDIVELIELHSPYLQERDSIMTRLDAAKDMQSQFASALQKNTEVMSELKIQIAVLGKTLQNLESRIEKEM